MECCIGARYERRCCPERRELHVATTRTERERGVEKRSLREGSFLHAHETLQCDEESCRGCFRGVEDVFHIGELIGFPRVDRIGEGEPFPHPVNGVTEDRPFQ